MPPAGATLRQGGGGRWPTHPARNPYCRSPSHLDRVRFEVPLFRVPHSGSPPSPTNGPEQANGPCSLIDGSLGARETTRTGSSRASLGTSPRPQGRQLAESHDRRAYMVWAGGAGIRSVSSLEFPTAASTHRFFYQRPSTSKGTVS